MNCLDVPLISQGRGAHVVSLLELCFMIREVSACRAAQLPGVRGMAPQLSSV